MDPEIKKELEEIHALVKDNHQMLRAIRRDQWLSFFGKIIFWIIVVVVPLYAYQQYLQPLVQKFSASGVQTTGLFGLPTSAELQKLINSYKAGQ